MDVVIFGLPTCSSTRAAVATFRALGRPVSLRDVRAEPLTQSERERFLASFGDALVNRASTTWRGLSEAERALPVGTLLQQHPAVMKRPVIDTGPGLHLGWTPKVQTAALA
jgi:arsenate reductase-like glutaredoxin family protein